MTQSLSPIVLGQLLVMQAVIGSLPDNKTIFSFVRRGLLDIPGVIDVTISTASSGDPESIGESFAIRVNNEVVGRVLLTLSDFTAYEPYRDYLNNFFFMLSVILEERKLRSIIESNKNNLENIVAERTAELEREIIERKKIEHALQESEKLFRNTFENAAIGICLTAMDGVLRMVNPAFARMFGYSQEELAGRNFTEFTHDEDRGISVEKLEELTQGEIRTASFEKRYIHKSGRIVWAAVNSFLLRNDVGEPQYFITHVEDITNKKRDEEERELLHEQLRQAHKMEAVGTLAGGIAHDFNNLLAAIMGFAELAQEDLPPASQARASIEQVLKAADRAKYLVQQILSFSRKEKRALIPVRISPLVKEGLKLLRASIPTTVTIEQDIDSHCENIMADPGQIHQILMNLCTNAAQAMDDEGGVLKVVLQTVELQSGDGKDTADLMADRHIMLSVTDTGAGMAEGDIPRIFDPYFTTKEVGKGTGMGLSVVLGLVKSHNGSIEVESTPGVGSVFKVFFPVIDQDVEDEPGTPEALPEGMGRLLLVDDEGYVVEMLEKIVTRLGYTAVATTGSTSALQLFRNDPDGFDLIITDQTMPDMSGEQLVAKIRQIRPEQPVILCTGYSSKMDESRARAAGINAFLMKPVARIDLAQAIRDVLNKGTAGNSFPDGSQGGVT